MKSWENHRQGCFGNVPKKQYNWQGKDNSTVHHMPRLCWIANGSFKVSPKVIHLTPSVWGVRRALGVGEGIFMVGFELSAGLPVIHHSACRSVFQPFDYLKFMTINSSCMEPKGHNLLISVLQGMVFDWIRELTLMSELIWSRHYGPGLHLTLPLCRQ